MSVPVNFTLSAFLLISFIVSVNSHFGYSRYEQLRWQEKYKSCGGNLQSPIRIESQKAIPLRMLALETVYYHDLLPGPLELHNNGHSVSLSLPKLDRDSPEAKFIPYVFGAKLKSEYEFEGLHFHWGDKNNLGSEHTFNDVRFPLELHIIHRNKKYPTLAEALNHTDGLTVLAFFYQLRENENKQLNYLIKMLPHVYAPNANIKIDETFTLASLLPPVEDMERFYTYRGSLTTPPCSEVVTWILFPNPMPVSVAQMNKFRSLSANDPYIRLTNNYREIQDTGPRRIFVRKLKAKNLRHANSVLNSEWDWLER